MSKKESPTPHSTTVRDGTGPRFMLHVRHDGVVEQLDQGHERDAHNARIDWTWSTVTKWSVMHVRMVLREKRSERVFTLQPSPSTHERVEFGEFYVEGEFEIVEKENNTKRARTLWMGVK